MDRVQVEPRRIRGDQDVAVVLLVVHEAHAPFRAAEGGAQAPLEKPRGRRPGGGHEHRVVARDGADHLGQIGLVEGAGQGMGARGRRADHHERGGGPHREHELAHRPVERAPPGLGGHEGARGGGHVAGRGLGEPERLEVAGEGRLGDRDARAAAAGAGAPPASAPRPGRRGRGSRAAAGPPRRPLMRA